LRRTSSLLNERPRKKAITCHKAGIEIEPRNIVSLADQIKRRLTISALVVGFAAAVCLAQIGRAQTPSTASGSGQPEKTAEQVYKNIQVLNGLPASDLDGVMLFMSAALGVGCTHCHTNPWDSDAKTAKAAARRMILLTRGLNKEHFSGNPAVTCYTCHHGQH